MDEKKLIAEVIRGNKKAAKIFYQKYAPALFLLIKNKIDKREDAEEILQDTFLSIFDSLSFFDFRSSVLTWAKSIALHEVADFYRKRKIKSLIFSHLPFLEKLASQALGPEMSFQQKEVKEEIEKVFACLSEGYREILRLKYIEGLSMAKIANLRQISVKAVESRLSRARLAFQKEWQKTEKSPISVSSASFFSKRVI